MLFAETACCFSHLGIHRVWCRSSVLALHLHCPRTAEKEGMLKITITITITATATEEKWTLQGRLVAPWVMN
jgi:hypothetical protein